MKAMRVGKNDVVFTWQLCYSQYFNLNFFCLLQKMQHVGLLKFFGERLNKKSNVCALQYSCAILRRYVNLQQKPSFY